MAYVDGRPDAGGGRPSPGAPVGGHGQATYDRLREGILRGELPPGTRLQEAPIAAWCGVSRTPVREALHRLVHDGLVVVDQHGRTVRGADLDELRGCYDVRIELESVAARWAALRRTDFDLARLEAAHRRSVRSDTEDPVGVAERHRAFHRALWRAAHSAVLTDLLECMSAGIGRYPGTTTARAGRRGSALREHEALVAAVRDRDVDTAVRVVRQHFATAREIAVGNGRANA